jgi:hypothetical protein
VLQNSVIGGGEARGAAIRENTAHLMPRARRHDQPARTPDGASYTALARLTGSASLTAAFSTGSASHANAAAAAAVFAVIQVFMMILQSFSSAQGGMGAMLRAEQALLGLIISQLTEIQRSLVDISI